MIDPYKVVDSIESVFLKLETFGKEFKRLATSPEQTELASQFADFVDGLEPAHLARLAMPAIERDYLEMVGSPSPNPPAPENPLHAEWREDYAAAKERDNPSMDMEEPDI